MEKKGTISSKKATISASSPSSISKKKVVAVVPKKSSKQTTELATSTGYEKEYIEKISGLVFRPIKETRGSDTMNFEEFEKLFEGKLGDSAAVKRFFSWFDTEKTGSLDLNHFCHGLAKLERGPEEEKLKGNLFFFCIVLLLK
jgi:Ca2+-binding EF-hand superfamily protein